MVRPLHGLRGNNENEFVPSVSRLSPNDFSEEKLFELLLFPFSFFLSQLLTQSEQRRFSLRRKKGYDYVTFAKRRFIESQTTRE